MADKRYIFLVDDEPIQNEMLKDFLTERFVYEIKTFENGEDMLQSMALNPEIVVLDYHLSAQKPNAKNGVEILKILKDRHPDVQVIMLSGQDKIDVAIDSMKYGAYDYVVKGETAFSRTENILNNISELHKVKTINAAYKKTITLLGVVIAAIVALSVYLYFFTDAFSHAYTKP
ncbi:MAG: response regulator [Bacteroidetes bacterium]|nr:response regulator [Bacteroidota bacterium]MBS1739257.1 response regulator [Bacteroidota bacterium]MBS1775556.1 response regulator [Bacteroidota bacterium]